MEIDQEDFDDRCAHDHNLIFVVLEDVHVYNFDFVILQCTRLCILILQGYRRTE